jgi:hypothetical protein
MAADIVLGVSRSRAMSIPTVARSRDLICSLVGTVEIRQYGTQWDGENLKEIPLPPESWMLRPDPGSTRSHILSWTADDLFHHGKAAWLITGRFADGFPASFQWLPWEYCAVDAPLWAGNYPIGGMTNFSFNGVPLNLRDVLPFWSSGEGICGVGGRAIQTAEKLDQAARRFSSMEIPAGWLKQTGGEPINQEQAIDVVESWAEARATNSIAFLSELVDWHESNMSPDKLQLVQSREHQALELARVCGVPPYMVGAPAGSGMTYLNAETARADLATFGAQKIVDCIEQTLSSDKVTPRGRTVRLDLEAWLRNPLMDAGLQEPAPQNEGVTR